MEEQLIDTNGPTRSSLAQCLQWCKDSLQRPVISRPKIFAEIAEHIGPRQKDMPRSHAERIAKITRFTKTWAEFLAALCLVGASYKNNGVPGVVGSCLIGSILTLCAWTFLGISANNQVGNHSPITRLLLIIYIVAVACSSLIAILAGKDVPIALLMAIVAIWEYFVENLFLLIFGKTKLIYPYTFIVAASRIAGLIAFIAFLEGAINLRDGECGGEILRGNWRCYYNSTLPIGEKHKLECAFLNTKECIKFLDNLELWSLVALGAGTFLGVVPLVSCITFIAFGDPDRWLTKLLRKKVEKHKQTCRIILYIPYATLQAIFGFAMGFKVVLDALQAVDYGRFDIAAVVTIFTMALMELFGALNRLTIADESCEGHGGNPQTLRGLILQTRISDSEPDTYSQLPGGPPSEPMESRGPKKTWCEECMTLFGYKKNEPAKAYDPAPGDA